MGGRAFPKLNCKRLNKEEFDIFSQKIVSQLYSIGGFFWIIKSYHQKDSFGDLDIVYTTQEDHKIPVERFIFELDCSYSFINGDITSLAIPHEESFFQVDLIFIPKKYIQNAYCYFAYNDLGNLVGRIFHRAGFKLGQKGLQYIIRDEECDNRVIKEVDIDGTWSEYLSFAGYDSSRWLKGFDTLEDVFEYAVSTPLASKTIFRLEETNHAARVRDRKRKTYQQFLQWIYGTENNVPDEERIPKKQLRKEFLEKAFETFPHFKIDYDRYMFESNQNKQVKNKFNGHIVSEVTGLTGKDLGSFIQDFIHSYIENELRTDKTTWVLDLSVEQIKTSIKMWKDR